MNRLTVKARNLKPLDYVVLFQKQVKSVAVGEPQPDAVTIKFYYMPRPWHVKSDTLIEVERPS